MATKAELQERVAELEAAQAEAATLYQISRDLNAARDEDELLHILTRPALEAGVFRTELMYFDLNEAGEPEWAEEVAAWQREGVPLSPAGTRFHLPEFPFARLFIASPDEPQFIADVTADERVDENTRNMMILAGSRALAIIPLTQAGRWVGVILLFWDEPHEFSKQKVAIYRALIGLASPAVHSRRLLAQTEKALAQSETLYEISRDLNTAHDEDALLQILTRPAMEAGALSTSLIYVDLNEAGEPEWFELIASWRRGGAPTVPVGARFSAESPVSRSWMASPNEPLLVADVTTDERLDESTRNILAQTGSRAMAIVPLIQAGRWVGIITLTWDRPHEFSEQEVVFYRALIGLAAPAVYSRRLLVEKERALVETLYGIGRDLNLARDKEELLQILARPALEAGAMRAELMYFDLNEAGEPEWAEEVAVWQREGIPLFPAGTRFHIPEFPLARFLIASQNEPLLVADATTDERVDESAGSAMAQLGSRALALIPLARAGRWIGLILLLWDEPHEFSPQEVAIYRALIGLASPAVESRRLVGNLEQMVAERTSEVAIFKTLTENAIDAICITNLESKVTYANRAFCRLYGYETREVIGLPVTSFVPEGGETKFKQIIPQALSEGWSGEIRPKRQDGSTFDAHITLFALRDEAGHPISLASFIRDITGQKRMAQERESLQQEIIETQRQALRELSTPIVPVLEGVLVLPLVGSIDTTRAQQIMETLLEAISRYQAEVVIVDITGVPVVDTGVANHLLQVTRAAALLGSECVLVGISPEVAQTIVSLGVDLSSLATRADLQSGVEYALGRLDSRIVSAGKVE